MSVRNTIRNILGLNPTNGDYGIEIECEGVCLPGTQARVSKAMSGWWRLEHDPSLKSRMEAWEYVMKKPASLKECRTALNVLQKEYDKNASVIDETDTSGVHVHVNVQEYTIKELYTLMILYLILEELVITFCGPSREGNHFCLRAKDAEYNIYLLSKSLRLKNLKFLNTEDIRYSSINPLSLFKYGSLEFRAMRGTGNLDAIYVWVEILDQIKKSAKAFPSPLEILFSYSKDGEQTFIQNVLGKFSVLFENIPNRNIMIRDGVQRIQSLVYLTDWDSFSEFRINPFPVRDERQQLVNAIKFAKALAPELIDEDEEDIDEDEEDD